MKYTYLIVSIIGFIIPTIFVVFESLETGNILLYYDSTATLQHMFSNRISTIFMIDLLFTVLAFFLWSYRENKKDSIKYMYAVWLLTLLFGLAGGFPLFLYLKEKRVVR